MTNTSNLNSPGVFISQVVAAKNQLVHKMDTLDMAGSMDSIPLVVALGTTVGSLAAILVRGDTLDTILSSEKVPFSISAKIAKIGETLDKLESRQDSGDAPYPVFLLKSIDTDAATLCKLLDKHNRSSACETPTKETLLRILKWTGAGAAAVGAGLGCAWAYKKYVKPAMPIVVVVGTGNESSPTTEDVASSD